MSSPQYFGFLLSTSKLLRSILKSLSISSKDVSLVVCSHKLNRILSLLGNTLSMMILIADLINLCLSLHASPVDFQNSPINNMVT